MPTEKWWKKKKSWADANRIPMSTADTGGPIRNRFHQTRRNDVSPTLATLGGLLFKFFKFKFLISNFNFEKLIFFFI
jgi:hypothetical protein